MLICRFFHLLIRILSLAQVLPDFKHCPPPLAQWEKDDEILKVDKQWWAYFREVGTYMYLEKQKEQIINTGYSCQTNRKPHYP